MRAELDKLLVEKFPNLYADRYASMSVTCMCWGFDCGDGWFDLINRLSEQLEKMILELPPACSNCGHDWRGHGALRTDHCGEDCACENWEPCRPRASQVKEKFGGLRFYMTTGSEEMFDLIDKAEEESLRTCEVCGKTGSLRSLGGWYMTRCNACFDEDKAHCGLDFDYDEEEELS
jgi:hypothetical protein